MRQIRLKKLITLALALSVVGSMFAGSAITGSSSPTTSTEAPNNVTSAAVNGTYTNTIATARDEAWKAISNNKAAGASIAVMDNGSIVYSEGFGMANREEGLPVTKDTIFNIGSVSKMFATTAIMVLVDDKKVDLDHKVIEYLPEFTMTDERYKDITVRMLLNHTAGLPGSAYANNSGYRFNPAVNTLILETLKTAHLKYAPGELAIYCNDGFSLAEIVVEKVSGKTFMDFLRERVFQPLGLQHAGRSIGELQGQPIAHNYDTTSGKRQPAEVMSPLGAGGLAMTPTDLCRFADSFSGQGTRILSDASLAEMNKAQPAHFTSQLGDASYLPYGLGWDITSDPDFQAQGLQLIAKGGETGNYSSFIATVPAKRVAVAVSLSTTSTSVMNTAITVLKALLQEKGLMRTEVKAVTKPSTNSEPLPQGISKYAGLWVTEKALIKIAFDQEQHTAKLYMVAGDSDTLALTLTYNAGSFYDTDGLKYRLVDSGGKSYFITYSPVVGIFAQKTDVTAGDSSLKIDMSGKQWLRRNVAPYEITSNSSTHIRTSETFKRLPGYIKFTNINTIQSADFAGMAGTALRDQSELYLFEKDGATWARVSEMIYSPMSTVMNAAQGATSVTIGQEGYNGWMQLAQDSILSFQKPTDARVIVFSPGHSVLYDSINDSGDIYAPAGSLIECAGYAGNSFLVNAR